MRFALTVSPTLPRSRDSGDPLGLRSIANRLARDIAPGLTQSTSLTRGFSLLCLGRDIGGSLVAPNRRSIPIDDGFLRLESWSVLSLRAHGYRCALPGTQRADRLLAGGSTSRAIEIDLDTQRLLRNQIQTGLWGLYRRSAVQAGLIIRTEPVRHTRPSAFGLTRSGSKLAGAARSALTDAGARKLAPVLKKDSIGWGDLWERPQGNNPSREEVKLLGDSLARSEAVLDCPLGRLRNSFDAAGEQLTLATVRVSMLTPRQVSAVRAARALRPTLTELESAFRAFITEGTPTNLSAGALKRLAQLDVAAWDPAAYVPRIMEQCRQHHGLDGLLRHHRDVYEQRGSSPWEVGDQSANQTVERFRYPDFGLSAPANLFREGVDPRG